MNTVLYVPRVSLAVRRKARKSDEVRVTAKIDEKDVSITLPIKDYPSLFFLPEIVAPGALIGGNAAWGPFEEPG